ncbi:hypothetical protein [Geodermatophilus normandii]|uniref:hypothetical protein n=1 Tax=Geodermatophilus normandii TaxID=1137989 RepID=UPI001953E5F5|nr:hypothetical protein [Geodermatophilus normandii]
MATPPKVPWVVVVGWWIDAAPKPGVEKSDTVVEEVAKGPEVALMLDCVGAGPRHQDSSAPAGEHRRPRSPEP